MRSVSPSSDGGEKISSTDSGGNSAERSTESHHQQSSNTPPLPTGHFNRHRPLPGKTKPPPPSPAAVASAAKRMEQGPTRAATLLLAPTLVSLLAMLLLALTIGTIGHKHSHLIIT